MIKLDKKLKIGVAMFSAFGVLILADIKPLNVNAELGTEVTYDLVSIDSSSLTAGVSSILYETINLTATVEKHEEEVTAEFNPFTEIDSEMWTTEYVNMHDAGTKSANVLQKVRVGTKVHVLGYENDYWYKVEYDGQTGYICSDYLSTTSPYKK